jgi:hypothetical protein
VLLRLAAGASVLALAGCGGAATTTQTTDTLPQLPPGCTVTEVNRIVTAFLARPDLAPPSFFELYASYESDGRTFVPRQRAKALNHLRLRLALGERDRLIQLRVGPQDVNHARMTFRLTRFGPDFRRRRIHGRLSDGAGTVDCAHGKVAAWVQRGP